MDDKWGKHGDNGSWEILPSPFRYLKGLFVCFHRSWAPHILFNHLDNNVDDLVRTDNYQN